MILKKFIKLIFTYFQSIYFYEAKKNSKPSSFKNLVLKEISSVKKVKNKYLKEYLKKRKIINRFDKDTRLFVLFQKMRPVSLGWGYNGKKWHISEINRTINIRDHIILFDFYTFPFFRNNGFYKKILLLIRNRNFKKKFMIYCSIYNVKSKRGIVGAGFNYINKLSKI